jgi:hypothetical protein
MFESDCKKIEEKIQNSSVAKFKKWIQSLDVRVLAPTKDGCLIFSEPGLVIQVTKYGVAISTVETGPNGGSWGGFCHFDEETGEKFIELLSHFEPIGCVINE